jgi:hypothetical protein
MQGFHNRLILQNQILPGHQNISVAENIFGTSLE